MISKKELISRLKKAIVGCFFVILGLFGTGVNGLVNSQNTYAIDGEEETVQVEEREKENLEKNRQEENNQTGEKEQTEKNNQAEENDQAEDKEQTEEVERSTENTEGGNSTLGVNTISEDDCKNSLGAMWWLVCPATGKISEAVDWLYEKIEGVLVINPISMEEGTPIYEIWKYFRGVTNIVFIIFLLVVIYSQITGLGITNYGIKKVLPKLIVAAVLVNLSFLVCSLAVDLSNIVGNGLRGIFTSIQQSTMVSGATAGDISTEMKISYASMYSSLTGGAALAVGGGVIAFETGAIWMLIPVVLGALVAVVSGLITIALRQAVVALLIMISPLAVVAYMLPNTEKWFKKWSDLLKRMLIFYPMFSLLFGASSLAGYAIIASAKDGFGLLLGTAIQIFPLFFSWSLMKMSGTFLETINTKMRGLAAKPLAANRAWADSRRQITKAKHLASGNVYTPSQKLMQYLSDRKIAREAELAEMNEEIKGRGMAYHANSHYKTYTREAGEDGTGGGTFRAISRKGERAYARQARMMRYERDIERDKNNLNKGYGVVAGSAINEAQQARLTELDIENTNAADYLKMERARGAKIEFDNAKGFHERVARAMDAHVDLEAIREGNTLHRLHDGVLGDNNNIIRYERMKQIMEGKDIDTSFVVADAAHSFNAQSQIVRGKFADYFRYTAPTQDVVNLLNQLTKDKNSNAYIDPIIAGLQTLNIRGDTDLIKEQLSNILEKQKVKLGTHASQSLANFLMFDVKDNDPFLRRFGKYINLETARMFNEPQDGDLSKRRTRRDISLYEYVNGEYIDQDENGNTIYEADGRPKIGKPKRASFVLLNGTSFKGMERTAIAEMIEAVRSESVDIDENGNRTFNYEKFKRNEQRIWDAIMPNIISDQFSFLSGSEQIVALGKGLTGIDVKDRKFAWEDIFGKNIANSLTPEQKKDYIEFLHKRTKKFLNGHVPVQIARSKSDMLEAIKTQYVLREKINDGDDSLTDADLVDIDYKGRGDEYDSLAEEKIRDVKKEFVDSFSKDALKGFAKMYQKGYQGEAKEKLIQLLDPEGLYEQFYPNGGNGRRNRRERREDLDDDDDGMPVGGMDDGGGEGSSTYNEARLEIESMLRDYRGPRRLDVGDYWNRVKDVILSSPELEGSNVKIEEIEESLSQYTDVGSLYTRIMEEFFGSD